MRFRWFVRKSDFDTELENERIDIGDICFILDRLRIYTRSSSFDFSNRPIYQGETSTSDSAGTWTVTIDGITELYDGLTVKVKITTGQGESYSTLNVNNLGANPVWFGYSVPLTSSTPLAANQEVILTYRTTASTSGIEIGGTSYTRGWVLSEGLKTTVGQGLAVSNGALRLNYGSVNIESTTQPVTGNAVYNAIPHTYIKSASVSDNTLTLTTQSDNTVDFTNTTYESKPASSGGADVSLVTTGEKYTWNSKYSKPVDGIPKTDLSSAVQDSLDKAAYIEEDQGTAEIPNPDFDPETDTVWNKEQVLSAAQKDQVKTNLGIQDIVFNTTYNATSNKAATMADIPSITGKEDKVAIESASGATLTAVTGKYYILSNVGTMTIILPTIASGTTTLQSVAFYISTGSSTAVTFSSAHSIYYSEGFEIAASTTYEVNAVYNGIAWVVASVKIIIPSV